MKMLRACCKNIIWYFKLAYYRAGLYFKLGIFCYFIRDIERIISRKFAKYSFMHKHYLRKVKDSDNSLKIEQKKLYKHEIRLYSQNGEDGITTYILSKIPHKKYFVEFGVEDGMQCNCRILKEKGYDGIMMDSGGDDEKIYKEFISAKNICAVFQKRNVPYDAGFCSIDIDGNDFWVWKALSNEYKFDLVIIEYNASLGYKESLVLPYRDDFKWDGTDYFGASIKAFEKLGKEKGYMLIYADLTGVNLFFLNIKHRHLLTNGLMIKDIYKPPYYGPKTIGHPHDLLKREYLRY
jgi:hypothetical protein